MHKDVLIRPCRTADDLLQIAGLFRLYGASLSIDLSYQNFDREIADLPGKYACPAGELLLAQTRQGEALGCVGLKPLSQLRGEMKRLFVLPAGRGLGVGERMTQAIIAVAQAKGYQSLMLDTLPSMKTAIALYGRLGFAETEPYYAPTPPGTIFMRLKLADQKPSAQMAQGEDA